MKYSVEHALETCKTYERILVLLDGSSAAEIILPYAEEIAAKFGSSIALMGVCGPAATQPDHVIRAYTQRIGDQVQHQLQDLGAEKGVNVLSEVVVGRTAADILRHVAQSNVSLIAMTSDGHSGDRPRLLENVASRVLGIADRPVLIARTPVSTAALQHRKLVKKILLPLDTSQVAEVAILHAEALAGLLDAEVMLLHVVEPDSFSFGVPPGAEVVYPPLSIESSEHAAGLALTYLEGAAKALWEKGLRAASEVISGDPATEIIKYAEANAIDLILVSTHGRGSMEWRVFGSVTQKLLRAGGKAILAVPQARR